MRALYSWATIIIIIWRIPIIQLVCSKLSYHHKHVANVYNNLYDCLQNILCKLEARLSINLYLVTRIAQER